MPPKPTTIMEMLGQIHKNIAELDKKHEVFATKFDGFKDANELAHEGINTHLNTLNGQVIKNTKFRWQVFAYVPIAIIVVSGVVTLIFNSLSD